MIIPAHNEYSQIADCLKSVLVAAEPVAANGKQVRVVVVLDRCTDNTRAVVDTFDGVESRTVDFGRVGAARADGARQVLANGAVDPARHWLANTDADSVVPRTWLSAMIAEADAGSHLVLGTVTPGPGLPARVARQWHRNHVSRPGHPHVHAANFGIRADAYLRLGGWPNTATGEDVALAGAAEESGLLISRTATIPVVTSSRLVGRAPAGFAAYLARLSLDLGHTGPTENLPARHGDAALSTAGLATSTG